MTKRPNEEFNLVVSTKNTKFGDMDFEVSIAPTSDLSDITIIGSGMTEAVIKIADDDKHDCAVTQGRKGSRSITIDTDNSDIVAGDVVDFENGQFGYVKSIDGSTVYLKTRLLATLENKTFKQAGNTGCYMSDKTSESEPGDYMLTAINHQYGILVQQRVTVVAVAETTYDSEVVAVAH